MTAEAAAREAEHAAPPKPAPALNGLVPYLQLDGAEKAAAFYETAFAAFRAFAMPADEKGRTMHIHLHVNGSSLMLSDPYPDYGHPHRPAQGYTLTLMVEDVDAWYERAIAAGCAPVGPPADMFWGDRFATVKDPFGVEWAMNGPAKG